MIRALLALLAVLVLAGCGDDDPVLTGKEQLLATALRDGGVVLVMRHAKTETATDEKEFLGDCSRQRNLSEEGREQARAIGRDVEGARRARWTRCQRQPAVPREGDGRPGVRRQHGRQMALRLGRRGPATPEDDDRRISQADARWRARRAGSATVLVTHTGNIGGAFGEESVAEGAAVVVRDGEVLGIVNPDDWKRLAEASE